MAIAALIVRIAADAKDFVSATEQASRSAAKLGNKLTSAGQKMSLGISLPLAAVGVAAIKAASDAEEAASKFDVVFGKAGDSMNAWIQEIRKSVPETTAELQGMSAEIQDLLVPLGLAPAAAGEMTRSVVQLAADLASFNNVPFADALATIRSGLVGQNEPLLKFGVALNAATVEARALELGLIQEGEAVTAVARAQAAYSLILEGTTAAHGDAARTAESAANQFKFLKANLSEAAVTIGQQLLPVVVPLVTGAANLISKIATLNPAVLQTAIVLAGVAAAAGPVLIVFGSIVSAAATLGIGIGAMLGIVAAVPIALAAIVTAGVLVVKNWDKIKAFAKSLWDTVAGYFTGLRDDVVRLVTRMMDIVYEQTVGRFTRIAEQVRGKIDAVTGFFRNMYEKVAGNSYVPDMMGVVDFELVTHLGNVSNAVASSTQNMSSEFKSMADQSSAATGSLLDDTKTFLVDRFADEVVQKSKDQLVSLAQGFTNIKGTILGTVSGIVDGIKSELLDRVKSIITDFLTNWDKIAKAVKSVVDKINELVGAPRGFNTGPGIGPGLNLGPTIDFRPLQEIGERQIGILEQIRDRIAPAADTAQFSAPTTATTAGATTVEFSGNVTFRVGGGREGAREFIRELGQMARSSGDAQQAIANTLGVLAA